MAGGDFWRMGGGMDAPLLPHLEFGASRDDAELCVLLMHGLGADGYDFADVARVWSEAALPRKWRFVLPHAPDLEVTINLGARMPAWYDILDLSQPRAVNWDHVAASQARIEALLENEPAKKIVLAGFSQGGAMALQVGLRRQESIAGILVMSGYLLADEEHPTPAKAADVPIGLFHGSDDPVVPLLAAEQAKDALEAAQFSPTSKVYPGMPHAVCEEEIRDAFAWLENV